MVMNIFSNGFLNLSSVDVKSSNLEKPQFGFLGFELEKIGCFFIVYGFLVL